MDTLERPSREEYVRFNTRLKQKTIGQCCSLRNQHFGTSAANTLSKFLKNRMDLKKLDMYSNVIRDQGLQALSHLFHLNPSIKIFNVGCNDLSDKSALCLAEIISFKHLNSLQLGASINPPNPNRFTSFTLDAIANSIAKFDYIQSLGFSQASFTNKVPSDILTPAASLVKIFQNSQKLKMLQLSQCQLSSETILEVIDKGLKYNSTLERFDLSYNDLSSEVGIRIGGYLLETLKTPPCSEDEQSEQILESQIPHIFYLNLSYNSFDSSVARAFDPVLRFHPYLGYLNLSGNDLKDDGAYVLANTLIENIYLVDLRLASCQITQAGGSAILQALMFNITLTYLDLSRNKLGGEFSHVASDFLKVNSTITHLDFSLSGIADEGGVCIVEATVSCLSLISLNLSNNFFTESAGPEMEKYLIDNKVILKCDVSGTQINHYSLHRINEICQRNLDLLKQYIRKPSRNHALRVQFSASELGRKEEILEEALNIKQEIVSEIVKLQDEITSNQTEDQQMCAILSKQIGEQKKQKFQQENQFRNNLEEEEIRMKNLETKRDDLQKKLDSQLILSEKVNEEIKIKRPILKQQTLDFETAVKEKMNRINELKKATEELIQLSTDVNALKEMEKLPEFLKFDDDNEDAQKQQVSQPVLITETSKAKPSKTPGKKKRRKKK